MCLMTDNERYQKAWAGIDWPAESLEYERRFGHPTGRLYPYLNKQVQTPKGRGRLLQVFCRRVAVVIGNSRTLTFLRPWQIRPIQKVQGPILKREVAVGLDQTSQWDRYRFP